MEYGRPRRAGFARLGIQLCGAAVRWYRALRSSASGAIESSSALQRREYFAPNQTTRDRAPLALDPDHRLEPFACSTLTLDLFRGHTGRGCRQPAALLSPKPLFLNPLAASRSPMPAGAPHQPALESGLKIKDKRQKMW